MLWAALVLSLVSLSQAQWDVTVHYTNSDCYDWISTVSLDGSQCHESSDSKYAGMFEEWSCASVSGLYAVVNVKIWDNDFCQGPAVTSYSRRLNERYDCAAKGDGTYIREFCSSYAETNGYLAEIYYPYASCNSNPFGYSFTSGCYQNSSYIDPSNCSPFGVYFSRDVECSASIMAPILFFSLMMIFSIMF